ncbi:MAG: hypothetical protein IJZ30_07525 [Alphaproteobacteria bacterium]|nr:hypothetical protein [Alphaproteobacteria bacterium]
MYKHTINHLDKYLDRATALQGVPGAGKSSSINSFGYLIAQKQWKELQHKYWLIMHLPYESLPTEVKKNHEEIVEAYRFYFKYIDTHIPCLHSIYTIYDNSGRQSHEITKGHLCQKKKLPYGSVWICDEISSMFPNDMLKKEPETTEKLKEQWRWIRHFTDSWAICADIRFGDAFLAIRSASGSILSLTKKQKWVLKPRLICAILASYYAILDVNLWLYSMFKAGSKPYYKVEYNLIKSSRRTGKFIAWLERLKNNIGYRKYFYSKSGVKDNGTDEQDIEHTKGCYYLKSCLDVKYNDRAFKNLYACQDQEIEEPSLNANWFLSKEELKEKLGKNETK